VLGACATLSVVRPDAAALPLAAGLALTEDGPPAAGLAEAEAGVLTADGLAAAALAGAVEEAGVGAEDAGPAPPPQAASAKPDISPTRSPARFMTRTMLTSTLGPRASTYVEVLVHIEG